VQIQAVNAAPEPSDWGAWSSTMVPAGKPDAPAAPRATRFESASGGRIDVTWDPPVDNGDTPFAYYLDVYRDGTLVEQDRKVTGTSETLTGLDTKASYTFAVSAENKAGEGATSPQSNKVTPYGRPTPPTTVTAQDDKGTPVVSWSGADGNGSPITGYTVTASNGKTMTTTGTSVRFTGLPVGASYTFTVTATNPAGTSEPSRASGAVPVYGVPSAPSVTWTKTSATGGYFTVTGPSSWNGDTGTVSWSLGGSEVRSGTGTGRIDVAGGYSKSYSVTVSATNRAGTTAGNSASGSTDAPPPPPNPQVTVSDSGIVYKVSGCNTNNCTRFRVNANADFPSGSHTFQCYDNANGYDAPFGSAYTTTLNANGYADLWCVLGISHGADVWVSVDGHLNYSVRTKWPR
jgi:hypothetical protein